MNINALFLCLIFIGGCFSGISILEDGVFEKRTRILMFIIGVVTSVMASYILAKTYDMFT